MTMHDISYDTIVHIFGRLIPRGDFIYGMCTCMHPRFGGMECLKKVMVAHVDEQALGGCVERPE
jgi:hypothetical protein